MYTMTRRAVLTAAVLGLLALVAARAAAGQLLSYPAIDLPVATSTNANGTNNVDQAVGYYGDDTVAQGLLEEEATFNPVPVRGVRGHGDQGSPTVISVPVRGTRGHDDPGSVATPEPATMISAGTAAVIGLAYLWRRRPAAT